MSFFTQQGRTLLLTVTAVCVTLVTAVTLSCSKKCGDTPYNAQTQFCYNNSVIADKCDGKEYNPEAQFCYENRIVDRCGDKEYNLATQFCYNNSIVANKCDDGREFNAEKQFCIRNQILDRCGSSEYDPETQICDTRDNNVYKYVKVGKQTWMAQNLNYQPQKGKTWCYDNDSSNCVKYGRLYNLEAANKACPAGWRLSAAKDWYELHKLSGDKLSCVETEMDPVCNWKGEAGKRLKAKTGWKDDGNGTDEYGFSALPGGWYDPSGYRDGGIGFKGIGASGAWWIPSTADGMMMVASGMNYKSDDVDDQGFGNGDQGYSVRCVKN